MHNDGMRHGSCRCLDRPSIVSQRHCSLCIREHTLCAHKFTPGFCFIHLNCSCGNNVNEQNMQFSFLFRFFVFVFVCFSQFYATFLFATSPSSIFACIECLSSLSLSLSVSFLLFLNFIFPVWFARILYTRNVFFSYRVIDCGSK